jgi:hypothetical protein
MLKQVTQTKTLQKNTHQQERVMRQIISGLIAAIAVVAAGTVPASACGLLESNCGQVVAAPVYSGCNCGNGWAGYEHLADPEQQYGDYAAPVHQYYFADQGPTYSGPGEFAPYPVYREGALGWGGYHHHGYYGAYHMGHHGWGHPGMRYGYHHGYSMSPRGYYGEHHNMRYGYHAGMPHHYGYGYGGHMMHRHY